jgi:hypothetical protein
MARQATPEQELDATAEIASLKEENLRLRDLLIGKDAELGQLRGRLAEFEEGAGRLLKLRARLHSLVPSPLAKLIALVRRRRG